MYADYPVGAVVVQKYGGTSVGTNERIAVVAARTAEFWHAGWRRIAVVVSAQSGETNRLIKLMKQVHPEPPAECYDMCLAAGEQVSIALVAAAMQAIGLRSQPFLAHQLGISTDSFHSKARILSMNTQPILEAWKQDIVPVIAGFQGVSPEGSITTLGRGGTDTSAVAIAAALGASFCEINTDVDGVYEADPRYVNKAKLIEALDFDVALEMASLGSKVLHPRCVELGKKFQLPLVVRNSFKPNDSKRTRIIMNPATSHLESPVVSGISLDENIISVSLEGIPNASASTSKVFALIAERGLNVDMIAIHRSESSAHETMRIGFSVEQSSLAEVNQAISEINAKIGGNISSTVHENLAKISIVGVGMRSHSGVAARMFVELEQAGISITMVTTSEIKVSCLIGGQHGATAQTVLHSAFFSEV